MPRFYQFLSVFLGFPGGTVVKNPPAMQETQETGVQFLSREDHLEEGMATHSSILAWSISWTEGLMGCQSCDAFAGSWEGSVSLPSLPPRFSLIPGLPWWLRWQRIHLQCGRSGFNPSVGKIPRRKAWQPTPIFLPGESHGQRSLVGSQRVGHD